MLRVLGVHGIGTHRYHRRTGSPEQAATALATDWFRHLGTAMPANSNVDLRVAYYAHLLHPDCGSPIKDDPAMLEPAEQQLFAGWLTLLNPTLERNAQDAGAWLARTHGSAARLFAMTFSRELNTYLSDRHAREAARLAVADAIGALRPDVVVAHSLGSIVAYETLWAHQNHDVRLFVTLGSPLAMPGVVADRLEPCDENRKPPRVAHWINIADPGDIAAVPAGGLAQRFGVDEDLPISAGMWEFQTPGAYLRSTDVSGVIFGRGALT
ncbi:serine peptidase [Amycolatopsis pithecellobii]|uniref:Serine peptidase n=1 Tax=Amycolatopsis pithecellobii TaxID=664692 RepID=A0A6N7YXK4_9PSEU|nr:serine peptidase [Amycolatopsis pithecellobii]MTD53603.1 serine peptidase [Amycolatopsis pithecellobii]